MTALAYITAGLPHAYAKEEFFVPELTHLIPRCDRLVLVPRDTRGAICEVARPLVPLTRDVALLSPRVLGGALAEGLARPRRAWQALRRVTRTASAATVLKNLAVLPKGLWLARLVRREGVGHIHAQWASTTATLAMVAHTVSGVPWSFTAHRGDVVQDNLLAEKAASAAFVRFICRQGLEMAELICGRSLADKAHVVHLGVALPGELRAGVRRDGPPVVLCPANLVPVKGHVHLLRALGLLRQSGVNATLCLAGEGALEGELRREAAHVGLGDSVRFLGQLPYHEVLAMYREGEVDVVALASVDLGHGNHEGIPVSLMEAMAHGVPVVSTTTGAIPELVVEGTGLLVPPADPAALADALGRVLGDPELRRRLTEGGRRRVAAEFDAGRSAAELARLIGEHS